MIRYPGAVPKPELAAADDPEADRPRYFHLLSDNDVRALRPVLEILRADRDLVLDRWFDSYVEHFGTTRVLSKEAFLAILGRDLDALVDNLLDEDLGGFEADVRTLGRELAERGVPFAEIVVSLHLFEESTVERFRHHEAARASVPGIFLTFDKLSHCRIIVLASAYFTGHEAQVAVRVQDLERDAERLLEVAGKTGTVLRRSRFHGLVGRSEPMQSLYRGIAAAAGGTGPALIVGESGTGKEVVARALHEAKGRSARPFIAVNCAALPRELIESELFGHRKGAYSGADVEYAGLVRSAHGGTLFLDEVTEMAVDVQAKLLRVIEERTIRAVGTPREIPVDVRFVASTNRDPEKAVAAGLLREDLYYRLNVHRIDLPPLRDRVEDLPELALHFAALLAERGLRAIEVIEPEALAVLLGYAWPGNVRELRSAVEQALTIGKGSSIAHEDLPRHIVRIARPTTVPGEPEPATPLRVPSLEESERELIHRALEATGGNKLQAAKLLHVSRHKLYDKLRKYAIA